MTAVRPARSSSQLYFRQAVQYLVDQPLYNQKINKGYGVGTYGPVPSEPENNFVSSEVKNNPYPYNPTKAVSLLKDHGWTVVPNGTSHLCRPGHGGQPVRRRHPRRGEARLRPPVRQSGADALHPADERREVLVGHGRASTMNLSQQSFNTVIGNSIAVLGFGLHVGVGQLGRRLDLLAGLLPDR